MIAQLHVTTPNDLTNGNILYEVTEDTLYVASIWACYTGITGDTNPSVDPAYFSIMIQPPNTTDPTTADENRPFAVIWAQELHVHESFNIAGLALPAGTKIRCYASQPLVTFTLTGTSM